MAEYEAIISANEDFIADVSGDIDVPVTVSDGGVFPLSVEPDATALNIDADIEPNEIIDVPVEEGLGGISSDHRRLLHRDASNQHPMSAITGLEDALGNIESTLEERILGAENDITDLSLVEEADRITMANAVIRIDRDITLLQSQVDGNITTWFYNYVPTLGNEPASGWIQAGEEAVHLGDLFYNTDTGYAYRWMSDGANPPTYSWTRITDSDVTKALADAAKAQDTADHKRRVFVTTPIPPYDAGDLWFVGVSGDILTCTHSRLESEYYDAGDWSKLHKYTDDTRANEAYNLANNAKLSADGKNRIYRQNSQPTGGVYGAGDVWFDTAHDNKIYRYDGSSWVAVTLGDDAIGNLNASHITAGEIDASQITVSNLDAGNITTGEIDASQITVSNLDAGNITTGYMDGDRLYANSVGANQIQANAITASKIAIGDFNNYVTVTEKDSTSIITSGDTIESGWLKTKSGYSAQCPRQPRWTTNGEKYRVTGTVKAPAAGCFMFVMYARNSDGSLVTNSANYRQVLAEDAEANINTVITLKNAGYSTGVLSDILVCFCTTTTWSENFQSGYIKNLRCERISDGHENLLMDSQKMSAWYRGTGATLDTTGEFGVITLNGVYNAWTGRADSRPTMRTSILDGTPLWVSFEYKASVATDFQFNIAGSASAEGSLDTTRTKYRGIARTLPVATSWTKYSFEHPAKTLDDLTSGSGDVNSLHLRFYNNTDNSVLQIRKVKLEHGLSATDWTPSPEEQKTYITRINDAGIRIHPASTTNDSVLIDSTGMEIFKGGTAATNSIAKFGALSSSSNVLCIKNLNNVTATVSSKLVISELNSSASGTAITMTVQRKNIDTDATSILNLSYVKGTAKSTYGISYDGTNAFYDENSDYVAYFVKIKFYISTASKTLRLGSTTTSNKGIVFGHRINNVNTDTFSVDINGNVNSLGNIVCANIGDNNCVNGGTIVTNISTTSGTTKALTSFSLEAGVYIVIVRVVFPSNATGYRFINVSESSANEWVASICPAINGTVTTLQFMQILAPTSTKTYYINAHQNSGTTLTIPSATLQYVRIR